MQAAIAEAPPVRFWASEMEVYKAPERLSTFEWAQKHLRVIAGPYKGQLWRPDVFPFYKAMMDWYDRPDVRAMFILGPSQCGKTTFADACLFSSLSRKLVNAGISMKDEKAVNRVFLEKIVPHIRGSAALRKLVSSDRNAMTQDRIEFVDGSVLMGIWTGSEARMRTTTYAIFLADEPDTYEDPGALGTLYERVTVYEYLGQSKFIVLGRIKGTEDESVSWRDAKAMGDVWFNIEACCPACRGYQVMDDRRIKSVDGSHDPKEIRRHKLARYECEHCGFLWTDKARDQAVRDGRLWTKDDTDGATTPVFHIRAWESTMYSLSNVLAFWFEAQGDPVKMKRYDNNYKCVPYKVITRETDITRVRKLIPTPDPKAPDHPTHQRWTVPQEATALTCFFDMQITGFWFAIRAWALSMASWLVDWGFIRTWEDVSRILDSTWPVVGTGCTAPIWRAGLDIGGTRKEEEGVSMTEEAKAFLQDNWWRNNLFGTKGASKSMPLNLRPSQMGMNPQAKKKGRLSGQMPLYILDTDKLKDVVHSRLDPDCHAPMWMHAESGPGELDQYISQLVSEKKVSGKNGKFVWDAGRRPNHLLDCEVGNTALADPLWTPPLRMLTEPVWIYPAPTGEAAQPSIPERKPTRRHRW